MTIGATNITAIRKLPSRREARKRRSDAPRQPRIVLGMEVAVIRHEWVHDFRAHQMWCATYWDIGHIMLIRGKDYLVQTRYSYTRWATRDMLYVRGHDRRYFNVSLNDPV